MRRRRSTDWTDKQRAELMAWRRRRPRPSWEVVAAALQRPTYVCQREYYRLIEVQRAAAQKLALVDRRRDPMVLNRPTGAAPPAEPDVRPMSTHRLKADAELLARIGAQGLTAGLLGDPPPGRSALDKRLAGEAPDPHRITLPTGRP